VPVTLGPTSWEPVQAMTTRA